MPLGVAVRMLGGMACQPSTVGRIPVRVQAEGPSPGRGDGQRDRGTDGAVSEVGPSVPDSRFQKLDRPPSPPRASRARGSHRWVGEDAGPRTLGQGRGGEGRSRRRRDLCVAKAGTHCLGPCSIRAARGGRVEGVQGGCRLAVWAGACMWGSGRAEGRACVRVVLGVRCGTVHVSAVPWACVGSASGGRAGGLAGGQAGSVDSGGGRAPAAGSWGFPEWQPSSKAIPP